MLTIKENVYCRNLFNEGLTPDVRRELYSEVVNNTLEVDPTITKIMDPTLLIQILYNGWENDGGSGDLDSLFDFGTRNDYTGYIEVDGDLLADYIYSPKILQYKFKNGFEGSVKVTYEASNGGEGDQSDMQKVFSFEFVSGPKIEKAYLILDGVYSSWDSNYWHGSRIATPTIRSVIDYAVLDIHGNFRHSDVTKGLPNDIVFCDDKGVKK